MSESGGSNSLDIVKISKRNLLEGGAVTLVFAIYTAFFSVKPYIVPMFNSWGNLFWGMLWLGYIFILLYLFSFCIKNYTLWTANEIRILKEMEE